MKKNMKTTTLASHTKGSEVVSNQWIYITVAVIVIVLLVIIAPRIMNRGFSDVNKQFCMTVDTDNDGVNDFLEKQEGRCICNRDIPSEQFYTIDPRANNKENQAKQTLFKQNEFPKRISFEDVMVISKYIYELEAYALNSGSTSAPTLTGFKSGFEKYFRTPNPSLNDFCFGTTCTIEDFKRDFFLATGKYTYETQCALPNDGDECKRMQEERCKEESEKAKKNNEQPAQS